MKAKRFHESGLNVTQISWRFQCQKNYYNYNVFLCLDGGQTSTMPTTNRFQHFAISLLHEGQGGNTTIRKSKNRQQTVATFIYELL
jgi:hypothetical protein